MILAHPLGPVVVTMFAVGCWPRAGVDAGPSYAASLVMEGLRQRRVPLLAGG